MDYITTATGIQNVAKLFTKTGIIAIFLTQIVRITTGALTMDALKTMSHSSNGLIALKTSPKAMNNVVTCLEITANAIYETNVKEL